MLRSSYSAEALFRRLKRFGAANATCLIHGFQFEFPFSVEFTLAVALVGGVVKDSIFNSKLIHTDLNLN